MEESRATTGSVSKARRTTFIVLTVLFGLGLGLGAFAFLGLVTAGSGWGAGRCIGSTISPGARTVAC